VGRLRPVEVVLEQVAMIIRFGCIACRQSGLEIVDKGLMPAQEVPNPALDIVPIASRTAAG